MVLNPELRDLQDARIHILKIKKINRSSSPVSAYEVSRENASKIQFHLKKNARKSSTRNVCKIYA